METRRDFGEAVGSDSVGTQSHSRLSSLPSVLQETPGQAGASGLSLRWPPAMNEPLIRVHDLEINTGVRLVKRAGKTIYLTPREYAILEMLAMHRGTVVSRPMIWEQIYDAFDRRTSNVVDVYIRHLRTKIDSGFDRPLIHTRRGKGYMLGAAD